MSAVANPLSDIQTELAEFNDDPLGFVMCAFPWGEGEMAKESGPREFQKRFLREIGDHLHNPATRHKPFRKAISSGHGIGKSALLAWIACWGLSTFEDCKVIVMAGTGDQLKTKTQPEVAKWFRRAVNSELFEVNVTSVKVREPGREQTWRLDFLTWSEENPQASAGAHNAGKRLIIIYDEAVGIPDIIWQTQEGAFTDAGTEIIMIAFSQCTRSSGMFFEATHGTQRTRWRAEVIDSRTVEGVNVEEINESIALYGADSDHVRVRWMGLYPLAGEGKFIDLQLVLDAQSRQVIALDDEPLLAGVDLSWGGSDDTVVRFRRGLDARSIPPVKIRGQFTKNPTVVRERLADVLNSQFEGRSVTMMFLDNSGVGGNAGAILAGLLALGFRNVMGINFGDSALRDQFYVLRRDEMWGGMKDWLRAGGAIDRDRELAADLQKPILIKDIKQRVKLEPKADMKTRLAKMGLDSSSPDDADALALTFAMPVSALPPPSPEPHGEYGSDSWMA
ncbi:MAG: putative phage terminase, large subunit [Candidatus Sulfotelmatobacter sp.]|nr:putative phage terminase, large subunit [Candidatus Sulfotelmatobacter sp.]